MALQAWPGGGRPYPRQRLVWVGIKLLPGGTWIESLRDPTPMVDSTKWFSQIHDIQLFPEDEDYTSLL